ncbi:MAG: hypothetical protein JWO68_1937 [Actinomycetia bacterium]|nr:hypothetical protein [Actinomycetes bacterium]
MITFGYETVLYAPGANLVEIALEAQVEAAAMAGFDWVGLDLATARAFLAANRTWSDLAGVLEQEGLRCGAIQSLVATEDGLDVALDELAEAVAALAPDVIVTIARDLSARSIEALGRAADHLGSGPQGPRLGVEFAPTIQVNSIARARELIRQAGVDAGVVLDTWHFFNGPDDWGSLERLPLGDIALVHFDDHGPRRGDDLRFETMHRRVLPGDGTFDLYAFADLLLTKGYRGPVAVEILSDDLRATLGPMAFARDALARSRPYWAL